MKNFFFKIKPLWFILLGVFVTFWELVKNTNHFLSLIILSVLSIIVSYYYFVLFYKLVDNRKSINIYLFFRNLKNDFHLNNQIKVVIFEELIFRVLPIYLMILFQVDNFFLLSLVTLFFSFLHFKNTAYLNLIIILEFFIFFLTITLLYWKYIFFPLLFFPHFIRNIFIHSRR